MGESAKEKLEAWRFWGMVISSLGEGLGRLRVIDIQ